MSISSPPTYTYITPGLLTTLRREMGRFLLHRYTRTPRVPTSNATDAWNLQSYTFGTPISGLPCFYEIRAETEILESGLTILNRPRLIVPFTDNLIEGDMVTNILTLDNTVILSGPVLVEKIQSEDPNVGGPIMREAMLRAFEFVPSDITTTT